MKKFGQIVLVFLLSVGMFTGCGTSYKADESTVFVLKDGKIVSTDVENFDEKTYDKDGLKGYVKNEIDTYNEKNGKGSVSLKKLATPLGGVADAGVLAAAVIPPKRRRGGVILDRQVLCIVRRGADG